MSVVVTPTPQTDRKRAHARPFQCERCGAKVFSPVYIKDPSLRRPGELAGRHLLDWAEADRDDAQAPYVVPFDGSQCRLISVGNPLADHETRHFTHHQTCPARAGGAHTQNGPDA